MKATFAFALALYMAQLAGVSLLFFKGDPSVSISENIAEIDAPFNAIVQLCFILPLTGFTLLHRIDSNPPILNLLYGMLITAAQSVIVVTYKVSLPIHVAASIATFGLLPIIGFIRIRRGLYVVDRFMMLFAAVGTLLFALAAVTRLDIERMDQRPALVAAEWSMVFALVLLMHQGVVEHLVAPASRT